VLARAQHGAEQLLAAAGLGQDAIAQVAGAILHAAQSAAEPTRPQPAPAAAFAGPPVSEPAPAEPPLSAAPPVSPGLSAPPESGDHVDEGADEEQSEPDQ
jgi:hypothetical protein